MRVVQWDMHRQVLHQRQPKRRASCNVRPRLASAKSYRCYRPFARRRRSYTLLQTFSGGASQTRRKNYNRILEARERGIIFDIGHGVEYFGFEAAETILNSGFLPDAISSYVHSLSIKGLAYYQLVTLSKFLNLGISITDNCREHNQADEGNCSTRDWGSQP